MHAAAYQLDYLHQTQPESVYLCYEWRKHWVLMYRRGPNRMLGETQDTFEVRDALTDKFLGMGDTKEEAEHEAFMNLQVASRKAFAQSLVAA